MPNPYQTPSAATPIATKRHSKFYFDDSLVVIQVEDTLFKVHKYQLLKSETFADMFNVPKGDAEQEGASPEHPIALKGVSSSDFEALMTLLYASYCSKNHPTLDQSLIIPAFRLANMWSFSDLLAYLLPLAKGVLSDVDKIVFAREFGIEEWLVPAHANLCQRPEPITMEEATKLGICSLLMISRLREQSRPSNSRTQSYCDNCGSTSNPSPGWTTVSVVKKTPMQNNTTSTMMENKLKAWIKAGRITD